MKRWPAVAGFVLFCALCASAAYWIMQYLKPPQRAVAAPTQVAPVEYNLDAAAGLFGGRKVAAQAAASNYVLKGVVVAGNPRNSVAILSIDGKPAQALAVDASVVRGVIIKEIHNQYVVLSAGGAMQRVQLADNVKPPVTIVAPLAIGAPIPAPPPAAAIIEHPAPARAPRNRRTNSDSD